MLILAFLLLPVALKADGDVQLENYSLTINDNDTRTDIRKISESYVELEFSKLKNLANPTYENDPTEKGEAAHFIRSPNSTYHLLQSVSFPSISRPAMIKDPSTLTKRSANVIPFRDRNFAVKVCMQDHRLELVEELKPNEVLAENCKVEAPGVLAGMLHLDRLGIRTFARGWYGITDDRVRGLVITNNEFVEVTEELLNGLPRGIIIVRLWNNKIERLNQGVMKNTNPIELLDFSKNCIYHIDGGAFENVNLTNKLLLGNNRLTNTTFLDSLPSNIRDVSLFKNNISEISSGNFSKFRSFSRLKISHNNINEAKSQRLRDFFSLLELDLSFNGLTTIETGFFHDLKNVQRLNLRSNKISNLEERVFSGLENIVDINLSMNNLTEIPSGVFSELPDTLQTLNLNENQIASLRAGDFVSVPKARLYLADNEISTIQEGSLNLPDLQELHLQDNPLKDMPIGSTKGLGDQIKILFD